MLRLGALDRYVLLASCFMAALAPVTFAFGFFEGLTRRPACGSSVRYDWDKSDVRREPQEITRGLDLLERHSVGGRPLVLHLSPEMAPGMMAF